MLLFQVLFMLLNQRTNRKGDYHDHKISCNYYYWKPISHVSAQFYNDNALINTTLTYITYGKPNICLYIEKYWMLLKSRNVNKLLTNIICI